MTISAHTQSLNFPDDIGDYDVLAYIENKNLLVNIECKHLQQTFSLKDSKDLREELFGKNSIEGSYVGKVVKQHAFLKEKWENVLSAMNWTGSTEPTVISVFCTKLPYTWTYLPSREVPISFKVIDELHDFFEGLTALHQTQT